MNIGVVIIVTFMFFAVVGGMAFAVYKQLKKTDPQNFDTSISDDITTAQEFLPFKDIRDGVIDLGGHNYRAILECSSTNYNLKTDKEKEIIEASFQRFVNSLTFPIVFFIQTKILDNSKMLEKLKEDIDVAITNHPQIEEYANIYFREMSNLSDYIGNNKQKKKYIIVPYNEAANLGRLSDKEKYEYSVKEVRQRASIIAEQLASVGVKAKVLDTKELIELVYSTYHKDNFIHYENIVNGEHLALIVQGEKNPEENLTNDMKMDWILYEAQTRIRNEITNKDMPDTLKKEYEKAVQVLDKLRDEYGAYYKN